jgi:hypothetical protein
VLFTDGRSPGHPEESACTEVEITKEETDATEAAAEAFTTISYVK